MKDKKILFGDFCNGSRKCFRLHNGIIESGLQFSDETFTWFEHCHIGKFYDNIAILTNEETGLIGYVKRDGQILHPCELYGGDNFNNSRTFISIGATVHLVNDQMQLIKQFDDPIIYSQFHNGIAILSILDPNFNYEAKIDFFVNINGNPVFNKQFKNKVITTFIHNADDFYSEDVIRIRTFEGAGFVSVNGSWIIPPKYDNATRFSEGLAGVQINNKWRFINKNDQFVLEPCLDNLHAFSEMSAAVCIDNSWGFVNRDGNWLIRPSFERVSPFQNGEACAMYYGKMGIIDIEGNWIINPDFDFISVADEGIRICKRNSISGIMGKSTSILWSNRTIGFSGTGRTQLFTN